mmetsp:Transcript_731/g.2843  ORF Transcript_731/g.2843 Transcript_731/m.2843 type:complete len:115 (-) Transcript_731:155-499(-)
MANVAEVSEVGVDGEEQPEDEIRAQMRERTLKMWLALRNSRVKLNLYSGVEVTGVFQAVDAKHENLVIADLDSGIGVVPVALVRWSDVLSMTTVPPAETNSSGPTTPTQASHAS